MEFNGADPSGLLQSPTAIRRPQEAPRFLVYLGTPACIIHDPHYDNDFRLIGLIQISNEWP